MPSFVSKVVHRIGELIDLMDWWDVVFVVSGLNWGVAVTISWMCFDDPNQWGELKYVLIAAWLAAGYFCFREALNMKSDNKPLLPKEKEKQ